MNGVSVKTTATQKNRDVRIRTETKKANQLSSLGTHISLVRREKEQSIKSGKASSKSEAAFC